MFDRARTQLAVAVFVAFGFVGVAACASELSTRPAPAGEGAAGALPVDSSTTDSTTDSATDAGTTETTAAETVATSAVTATTAPEGPEGQEAVRRETTTTTTTTTTSTTTSTTTTSTLPPIPRVKALKQPLAAVGTSSGDEAARIQQRLLDLGFWVDGVDGAYGLTTQQAVMAFQKYWGLEADGVVGEQTAAALSSKMTQPHARANSGTLVEVDKARQLLFFVIDGRTEWILNTSTGDGQPYEEPDQNSPGEIARGISLTPDGLHAVDRERPEGWWEGDLGKIYRPKYFVGGVAVHGAYNIPNYPASHGCVRVSIPAMDWIWDSGIMPMRTPVWVHDGA